MTTNLLGETVKETAVVYRWCQEHGFNPDTAERLIDIMRGETCDLCMTDEPHIDLILSKSGDILMFRAQCRDCGTQWVPEGAEDFMGFGVI